MIVIVFNFTYDLIENIDDWHRRYRHRGRNVTKLFIIHSDHFYPKWHLEKAGPTGRTPPALSSEQLLSKTQNTFCHRKM